MSGRSGMRPLTDRQRVELALPAAMLYRVFATCVARAEDHPDDAEMELDRQVLHWLAQAAVEPLDPARDEKQARRVSRLQRDALAPLEDRPVMTVFLVVLYWLQEQLETGVLTLIEGSAFDRAVTLILENLERFPDEMAGTERSARKGARRLGDWLRERGYYLGGGNG